MCNTVSDAIMGNERPPSLLFCLVAFNRAVHWPGIIIKENVFSSIQEQGAKKQGICGSNDKVEKKKGLALFIHYIVHCMLMGPAEFFSFLSLLKGTWSGLLLGASAAVPARRKSAFCVARQFYASSLLSKCKHKTHNTEVYRPLLPGRGTTIQTFFGFLDSFWIV